MSTPFLFFSKLSVLQDELATAMQMVGITDLSQAHPGLLNTAEIDPYVYRGDAHPWARKIVRKTPTTTTTKNQAARAKL